MKGRWGILGALIWLGATLLAIHGTRTGVNRVPVTLTLPDETQIHGTIYRPVAPSPKAPPVIVLHGTALGERSCAPGLSVPLARIGLTVLALDLPGHGSSGGSIPRAEFSDITIMLKSVAEVPVVDAGLAYLRQQESLVTTNFGLVGHSRGGWLATSAGITHPEAACVVAVSSAPLIASPDRPRNLLLLAGGLDEVIPQDHFHQSLGQATGGQGTPGPWQGDHHEGTARQLVMSPWSLHLSTLADPSMSRRAIQWTAWSLRVDPGPVAGDALLTTGLAITLATLGALIASSSVARFFAERLLPQGMDEGNPQGSALPPALPSSLLRSRLRSLGILGALLVSSPLACGIGPWIPDGGVLFANVALGQALVGALVAWLVSGPVFPKSLCSTQTLRGLGLGLLVAVVTLGLLGISWGITFLEVVPTWPRVITIGILLVGLFPASLMLAACLSPRATSLFWFAVALAPWVGHLLVVRPASPLLGIPILFLTLSALAALPLWMIVHRPGMTVARALTHALTCAWFLGTHLPFVQD